MSLGTVIAKRSPRGSPPAQVALTANDALELGRMLHGEGGSADATHAATLVWTVVQRWQWLPRWRDRPLIEFLRQFSEPLMRERLAGGADCIRMPHANTCDAAHMTRRAIIQGLTWDQLSDIAQRAADGFVTGTLPNPVPGSIDFAAWPIGSTNYGYVPIARFRANVFYAYAVEHGQDTRRWSGDEVYVQLPDGSRSRAGARAYGIAEEIPRFIGQLLSVGL